jgi:hypothetical protein
MEGSIKHINHSKPITHIYHIKHINRSCGWEVIVEELKVSMGKRVAHGKGKSRFVIQDSRFRRSARGHSAVQWFSRSSFLASMRKSAKAVTANADWIG